MLHANAQGASCRPHPAAETVVAAMGRALQGALERVWGWHERSRQRRALGALTDAQLKDIGLSRAEASRESGKPFWTL